MYELIKLIWGGAAWLGAFYVYWLLLQSPNQPRRYYWSTNLCHKGSEASWSRTSFSSYAAGFSYLNCHHFPATIRIFILESGVPSHLDHSFKFQENDTAHYLKTLQPWALKESPFNNSQYLQPKHIKFIFLSSSRRVYI